MNWWPELTCAALFGLLEGLWDSGAQGFFGFNSRQLHREAPEKSGAFFHVTAFESLAALRKGDLTVDLGPYYMA